MSKLHLLAGACLMGAVLAGCGQSPAAPADTAGSSTPAAQETADQTGSAPGLPDVMDCVREEGGVLIAAHRGGPAPGYPENAVETLQYAYDAGAPVMEIDVAESRDGVLFLMHDRSLTRTTSGEGPVADADWADISKLRLVDNEGRVTQFPPPQLSDALDWAVETGAILELDRKETTSFRNIVEAVRAAGAENNVIMITYNDEEAWQVAELAPDLMMTAGVGNRAHEAKLLEGGVDPEKLIAWTGTNEPSPGKWRGLASKGIESAFGTLGRPGERLDDQYWADGDPSEYESLVESGLVLLATDEPYRLLGEEGLTKAPLSAARGCIY